MMPSRGMGDINPSKMPNGKKKARRDDTDFTQYKEGGKVKAKYMKFSETGEPVGMTPVTKAKEKAIKSLSSAEYAATTKAKRAGKAAGKQFVAQPKTIAKKTAGFR